ncbi:DUF465 domain-containing protein [Phenylobacterium sp. LH3H17]|uniref:YdcH family protein n=1 Tax=Phenylobacterium sp. LH3H17 TaxID=2903901 RepID=UPI0020C95B16|nr:DUF465 domain-containing protein [Phenylobacterium sp. LH3H17]UTP40135.1 DUF465 domain-containing protein [Phenylobacterium sp. LH3H17]
MNDDEIDDAEARFRAHLGSVIQEHSDLDAAVEALSLQPVPDMMVIARLKRKKLALKDEISRLRNQLTPDIIA